MKSVFGKIFMLSLCMAVLPAVFAAEGLYWETEQITSGMPGANNSKNLIKTYQTEDAYRIDNPDGITIFKFRDGNIIRIDDKKKTYSETPLDQMFGDNEKDNARAREMMKKMAEDVKIEKTSETETINGYKCTKYNVSVMGIKTEQWVTEEIKAYNKLKEKIKKQVEKYKDNPMLSQMLGLSKDIEQVKGFPMKTVTKMGAFGAENTVQKVEVKNIDDSIFAPPSDYAKVAGSIGK